MTSMTLYLRYEYIEKGCLDLYCFQSDIKISGTKLIKLDIAITIIIILASVVHFCRILIFVYRYNWFRFKGYLDKTRLNYASKHARLLTMGFGQGYEFGLKRLRLNKAKYLMVKLEALEQRQDEEEERFEELHKCLGQ